MTTLPTDPAERRMFNLGQISAYDDCLQRLTELAAEIRSTRAALTLPTRYPRQNKGGDR